MKVCCSVEKKERSDYRQKEGAKLTDQTNSNSNTENVRGEAAAAAAA